MLGKEDRIAAFRGELAAIGNAAIRDFTVACLGKVPEYFFTSCPSSSSGKYHPEDEMSGNGTILHSKRICRLLPVIAEAYDIRGTLDLMLSAAILHDSFKQGTTKSGHTQKNHPILAADSMADVYKLMGSDLGVERNQAEIIYKCIRYHMGKWGTGKSVKPLCDFSREEMAVHLCDVAASKRFVKVNLN